MHQCTIIGQLHIVPKYVDIQVEWHVSSMTKQFFLWIQGNSHLLARQFISHSSPIPGHHPQHCKAHLDGARKPRNPVLRVPTDVAMGLEVISGWENPLAMGKSSKMMHFLATFEGFMVFVGWCSAIFTRKCDWSQPKLWSESWLSKPSLGKEEEQNQATTVFIGSNKVQRRMLWILLGSANLIQELSPAKVWNLGFSRSSGVQEQCKTCRSQMWYHKGLVVTKSAMFVWGIFVMKTFFRSEDCFLTVRTVYSFELQPSVARMTNFSSSGRCDGALQKLQGVFSWWTPIQLNGSFIPFRIPFGKRLCNYGKIHHC